MLGFVLGLPQDRGWVSALGSRLMILTGKSGVLGTRGPIFLCHLPDCSTMVSLHPVDSSGHEALTVDKHEQFSVWDTAVFLICFTLMFQSPHPRPSCPCHRMFKQAEIVERALFSSGIRTLRADPSLEADGSVKMPADSRLASAHLLRAGMFRAVPSNICGPVVENAPGIWPWSEFA